METEPQETASAAGGPHPPAAELLVTLLETHHASCPHCGYSLGNLREPRCPECGRDFVITLGEKLQGRRAPLFPAGVTDTEYLLDYLRTHDALCPVCQYNLRNLTEPRCPECGREIRIMVGLTEPHLRALVTCLVALSLSAGCGVLCTVILASEALRWGLWPSFRTEWPIACLFYGTVVSIIPTIVVIFMHRRFIRLQKSTQYLLAMFAWTWDGALFLLLMGLVFRIIR